MPSVATCQILLFMIVLMFGCARQPAPIDTSHLAALRLESIDLDADQIEFALYNTTEWELHVGAHGDYYLGEIVVISDGKAAVFMVKEIATGRLIATYGYERSQPLAPGDCVRWSLSLSDIVRVSGEQDMEALLLGERIRRQEAYERDPDAYRVAHGIPANRAPIFIDEEPLPLPPSLLEHLSRHPDSIVAVQPLYMYVGRSLGNQSVSYGDYSVRSNWLNPTRRPLGGG